MGDRENRQPRAAVARVEQGADVERLALHPGGEAGRRQQVVEQHRQREALAGGVEGVQVHHPDAFERRRLDLLDQARQIEVATRAPLVLEQVGEQNVLAAADRIGVDLQQREQARDARQHALAKGVDVVALGRRRRRERLENGERPARLAAGRIDGAVDRAGEAGDALRGLIPLGQAAAPGLGHGARVLLAAVPGARRGAGFDPGQEVGLAQLRKGQQQVAEIALGVDGDHRDAVDRRLFDQRDAETGLAAAGHADAHGVRGQVLGVVEQRLAGGRAAGGVDGAAEIEGAELFVVAHRCNPPVASVLPQRSGG